jgi:hypothetical protein
MKFGIIAAATIIGAGLAACAGIPGTGGKFDFDKFVNNPACDHTDKVSGVTGAAGIPASLQFEASRVCHAAPPPALGTVVVPAAAPTATPPT